MSRVGIPRPVPVVKYFKSAGIDKTPYPLTSRPVTKSQLELIYRAYNPILQANRSDSRFRDDESLDWWISRLKAEHKVPEDESMPAPRLRDLIRHLARNNLRTFFEAFNSKTIQILSEYPVNLDDENGGLPQDVRPHHSAREFYEERLSSEKVDALISAISRKLWSLPEVKQLLECTPHNGWQLSDHWDASKYYPLQASNFIFDRAMRILSDICYDFMKKWFPNWLKTRQVEYSESFELPIWLTKIYEVVALGRVPQHALKKGYSVPDARNVMTMVRDLRNRRVHTQRQTPDELIKNFECAIEFADMCQDHARLVQLKKLHEVLKQGPAFLDFLSERQAAGLKKEADLAAKTKVLALLVHHGIAEREKVELENMDQRVGLKRQFSIEKTESLLGYLPESVVGRDKESKEGEEATPFLHLQPQRKFGEIRFRPAQHENAKRESMTSQGFTSAKKEYGNAPNRPESAAAEPESYALEKKRLRLEKREAKRLHHKKDDEKRERRRAREEEAAGASTTGSPEKASEAFTTASDMDLSFAASSEDTPRRFSFENLEYNLEDDEEMMRQIESNGADDSYLESDLPPR
ncbi:hypothetical protein HDK77DRAFT_85629 [Phyllosticta capitalensis]|uniref:Uncharacterized protein n=1 Tax=Phyllosticta capitalensis TaxID=121624 RepID=A0ABR1YD96_9PEZI